MLSTIPTSASVINKAEPHDLQTRVEYLKGVNPQHCTDIYKDWDTMSITIPNASSPIKGIW